MMMKVLVLYNQPLLPAGHPDYESEHEILPTVEEVRGYLHEAGHHVSCLAVSGDPDTLFAGLREHRPDMVFNLFEGLANQVDTETHVAGLLECLRIPFTGSPSHTLTMARRKQVTKRLLRGADLPTPPFLVVESSAELLDHHSPLTTHHSPLIVKPAEQDASVGLDHGSVVTNARHLQDRVELLLERYGPPVLVEEFIAGREFNVAIVTAPRWQVLPISEIVFQAREAGYWPIVTYDAKWKPGSAEDMATMPRCPADVPEQLADRLGSLAEKAFHLLGCRDYARIDFRVSAAGEPFILEVNPNPDFSSTAGLARALSAAGISHTQFTVDLVKAAMERYKGRNKANAGGIERK